MACLGKDPGPYPEVNPRFFRVFPRLDQALSNWTPASPADSSYNCIGWAAGDNAHWWQPTGAAPDYWPPAAPLEPTIDAYRIAFESLGFSTCDSGTVESGYE